MARLTGDNIEQFRSGGGGDFKKINYFSLREDKETARIRLLYEGADDIEGYSVHRVKVGDWELPVNCLLEKDSPIDDCPFCRERYMKQARVYVPVYDEDAQEFKFWDRPNSFYGQLTGLCARYPNIVSQVFEVERSGEKGSNRPSYQFYPIGQPDGTTVNDILDDCELDEMPNAVGTKILDKTADEMEYYIQHKEFPSKDSSDTPVRRRGSEQSEDRPARRGRGSEARGRGDRF
jgi:hypothetical protein